MCKPSAPLVAEEFPSQRSCFVGWKDRHPYCGGLSMLRSLNSKLFALVLAAIAPLFASIVYNAAEERTSRVAVARQEALGLASVISREHARVVDAGGQFTTALVRVAAVMEGVPSGVAV